jgi:hypothetical protein
MPEYVLLGRSFRAKKGRFSDDHGGRIIGSRDAVYLVVYNSAGGAIAATGGLVGGVVAAVGMALSDTATYEQVTTLAELPKEVTNHPDWPIRGVDATPVIVVPRASVKKIRNRWWSTFDLVCENQSYYIGLRLFGRRAALKQMREWGWDC